MSARHSQPISLLIAIFLLAPASSSGAQDHPFWHTLTAGEHEVGFRRVWTEDPSRVWSRSPAIDSLAGSVARPLRIDVWYPAACAGTRMTLRGYVEMESPSPRFDDLVFLTHRWDEYSYRGLAQDSVSFDRLMATPVAACREARPAPGRFPLLVYSAGWFNRAPDNTVLAEYLASHGFVVAAVPQINPGLWTFSFTSDAAGIENQVRDLEVAIAALGDDPSVDRRMIAAMGYSTGGDVALLLQARNPLIDAVVGLDASWTLGPGNDVISSDFFLPELHAVPILALRRPDAERPAADEVLDSLSFAPRLIVEIAGGDHGTFSDDPVQRLVLDTDTEAHADTHSQMARVARAFLAEALREGAAPFDGGSLGRRLEQQGVTVRFRAPVEPNPDAEPIPDPESVP